VFPRAAERAVWPRKNEGVAVVRTPTAVSQPGGNAFRVSRADALPDTWTLPEDAIVWAAGGTTWRRLAARGVWVNGSADGLGDDESADADLLAGRRLDWISLTHDRVSRPGALATYHVEYPLPDDLASRSHFYWTSGDVFQRAIARWPSIKHGWHASGPGRTRQLIEAAIGSTDRTGIWLDRESWEQDVCL
jgi:hydroxymethylbilane synthase